MTNAQWRTLTLVLAVIFLFLVAFLVVLVLGRGGGAGVGPTAAPSIVARSPGASVPGGSPGSPASSPGPSEGAAGATGSPTAEGTAAATPSPTAPGAVPPARAIIKGLGIDDPASPQARPRVVVFTSDGGGDVAVRLQNASGGKVTFCLYPGTLAKPLGDPACLKTAGSTLTGHAKSKKPFTWTVTLIGVKAGTTPVADLRIDWPVTSPKLEIIDVRLQGKGAAPYDGVVVDLGSRPSAGRLEVTATWHDPVGGDVHPYAASITDRDSGATLDSATGEGTSVELAAGLAAKQRAEVSLRDPGPTVATEVLAALTLTWP